MKFGKKKPADHNDRQHRKQQRKKIWEEPGIVEDLFSDKDWKKFDADQLPHATPTSKMAKHIHAAIDRDQKQQEKDEQRQIRTLHIYRYAIAATILLLLSFSVWKWKFAPEEQVITASVPTAETLPSANDSLWVSVSNAAQQIKTISLPDQSTAKLFANTTIRYKRNFSPENREIHLDGKAYFAVQADPARPFSVYAAGTKTTALGTSFTINSHSKNKQTSVELHSGKVMVASLALHPTFERTFLSKKGESLLFDADMQLIAHTGKDKQPKVEPKPQEENCTAKNILRLDNIPLTDVFAALSDAYSIDIKLKDEELTKIQYTGTIDPQTEKLTDVLAVICLINDLRYVAEQDGSYSIFQSTKNEQAN